MVIVYAQSLGVFGLCQLYAFVSYVRSRVSAEQFALLLRFLATVVGGAALLAFLFLPHLSELTRAFASASDSPYECFTIIYCTVHHSHSVLVVLYIHVSSRAEIAPWTGRFYSLLDPSYAKNYIPIIASVSEHQPTDWASYYFDLQILVFLFPGTPFFPLLFVTGIFFYRRI